MNKNEYWMGNEYCRFNPMVLLYLQRHKAKMNQRYAWLRQPKDVEREIRKLRKEFMGSDLSLEMFVRENDQPLEKNVILLSRYLGKYTAAFLAENDASDNEELCTDFFYYGLQLYAYGTIGDESVDDLILLAETYARDPEILAIVGDTDLPKELASDWRGWLMENDQAPTNFVTATIGAVSVFLGVLQEL